MGILDAPNRKYPLAPRGSTNVAWLGDSLTANGLNQSSFVGTIGAAAAGATTITLTDSYPSDPSEVIPHVGDVFVLDPGLTTEEYVYLTAVTGTAPTYTITVGALAYAHSAGAVGRTSHRSFSPRSVPMWATILSAGRLRLRGVYAHGSYTSAEIQQTYLPQILALNPLPGVVVVNVGRNDIYATSALTTYAQILDTLIGRGILPVVTSGPPDNTLTPSVVPSWNLKVSALCQARGIPYVDIYSSLVDDGSGTAGAGHYKAGWQADNVHPSEIGAKAWAQAIVNAIVAWFPFYADPLSAAHNNYSGDTSSFPLNATNAVLLTDTNADGIPDGWTKSQSNTGDTIALVAEAGIPGKMLSITRAAAGVADTILYSSPASFVVGHRYRAFLRLKTSGIDAAYDNQSTGSGSGFLGFDVRLTDPNHAGNALFSINQWTRDVPLTTFSVDFTAPSGLPSANALWLLQLRGSSASTAYTVEVQPWLVDLTAAGA